MIKIQEHWSADESREAEYDFSRVEQLVQRADELDLGVYLGLDYGAGASLGLAEIPRLPLRLQLTDAVTISLRSTPSRWMASRDPAGITPA